MSYVDNGRQKVIFRYNTPLDDTELNTLFSNIINPGIYSGMALSANGAASVNISTGTVALLDVNGSGQMVIVNTAGIAVVSGVAIATPYICAKYEYRSESGWFADFFATDAAGAYATNVVILGRVASFSGATPATFDLGARTYGDRVNFENIYGNLQIVEVSNGSYRKVRMLVDGQLVTTEGVFAITAAAVTAITFDPSDATLERKDVVAVTTAGALTVIKGTNAAVGSSAIPSFAGYYPLAAVRISPSSVTGSTTNFVIYASDITDLRPFVGTPSNYLDFTARGYIDSAVKDLVAPDFNNLIHSGRYYVSGAATNFPPNPAAPSTPSTKGYLIDVNSNSGNTYIVQKAVDLDTNALYFRIFDISNFPLWGSWKFEEQGFDVVLESPTYSVDVTHTFTPTVTGPALVTIVGGGGGGGGGGSTYGGGGGGGGHVIQIYRYFIAGYNYQFVVGSGGSPGSSAGGGSNGGAGNTSSFDGIQATGGGFGYGGGAGVGVGGSGGSGGGGGGGGAAAGSGEASVQYIIGGGNGSTGAAGSPNYSGSGGGRSYGSNATSTAPGVGGGTGGTFVNPPYGGGGGGAGYATGQTGGNGGNQGAIGNNGTRGGGGGGGSANNNGGNGGNGVIYIKYGSMQF